MAEPLILAYGRGELPEFPASADTIVDIVPVDHVVSAIVAVLAHPPEPGDVGYFHVSSGDRNPLTFNVLYTSVREYFDHHPFIAGDRGAARLPDWRFPGARSVERLLSTSEKAFKVADYVLGHAPRSDRARDLSGKLHQQGRRLEFLRRYLDLYMEYATAELRFSDKKTMALFESLSAEDRETFAFDTSVIDWPHYFIEVHCPSVTAPVRRLDELRALRKKSTKAGLRQVGSGAGVAAFFDMDGTLLSSNVIETYLWVRLREFDGAGQLAELGRIAAKVPSLVQAERRQRSDFLRAVYREYEGARLADLDAIADEHLTDHILSRLSPDAVRRIREHRAAGHQTVLITGAIRPLTRALRPLFDHIEAADLATDDRGICNGHLASSPLVGESRAAWMQSYAAAHDIDMKASYGYADSHSDLPLLEAVGNPVAVRPDVPLFRHAKRAHWDVVDWASPSGSAASSTPPGAGSEEPAVMLALEMFRSLPRTVAGKAVGARMPGILSGYAAPLRLVTLDPPKSDRPGWARLRSRLSGICGSDLGALSGKTSLYFSAVVSLPFVPGHEVVGELLEDCEDLKAGTRVVLDPVLTCAARGVEPCENCSTGHTNTCSRITVGDLAPGLQTGFCKDTGGGWGQQLVAHRSQMHVVPEGWSDEQALLMEPLSCAVHTALRAGVRPNDRVLVSGAGSVGLFATLALRQLTPAGEIVVVAKHGHQRDLALEFGATEVVKPGEVLRRVRRSTGAFQLKPDFSSPYLLGGVDVAIDAVGSKQSLETALQATRAGGRVVLSGMPAPADLSAAWFRELEVVGTYASSQQETLPDGSVRGAFDIAADLAELDPVVRLSKSVASYPLHRWREALDHAHAAGRLGTVKVAFDPRSST